ncbi:MAG: 16S rRNA (guanine(966)-N(2))-methyltransferase RsmD [Clostridia bacterium]
MRVISGTARGTKLYSLDGVTTRPTLDRVKESLFNILQHKVQEANVLDLFAGSGALGIEAVSRGAKRAVFCDKSPEAIEVIEKNIHKTKMQNKSVIIKKDYRKALEELKTNKEIFDLIFLDPPYESNLAIEATTQILTFDILTKDGMLVIETDDKNRILEKIENLNIEVQDLRKYGRAYLIFLNRKG